MPRHEHRWCLARQTRTIDYEYCCRCGKRRARQWGFDLEDPVVDEYWLVTGTWSLYEVSG